MTTTLEDKKKKLAEKIEKFELQKKMLEAKERKKRVSKFHEIGKLANKAGIDGLDEQILLGAFLEIAKARQEKHNQWKEQAQSFYDSLPKDAAQVFSIYFVEEPPPQIKNHLKKRKFIWNRFKREYCGRGNLEDLTNLLHGLNVKIEEIIN